jgi:hypothetical protein
MPDTAFFRPGDDAAGRIHDQGAGAEVLIGATVIANTNPNGATNRRRIDTALKPTGESRRGTHLPCQRCSTNARRCKTSSRPCAATKRRAGTGCEGRTGRSSSVVQSPDPRQRRIARSHPGGHACRFDYGLVRCATSSKPSASLQLTPDVVPRPRKGFQPLQFYVATVRVTTGRQQSDDWSSFLFSVHMRRDRQGVVL